MKKVSFLLLALTATATLSAQTPKPINMGLNRAENLTTKGFAEKKATFRPDALDSLLKCDEYVMLISSFEGCGPCEWLRTSDVFDVYPITPYYTDMLLNQVNATIPQTFHVTGFPTCIFFDKSGEIVSMTYGTANFYEKLDRIVKNKEKICQKKIGDLDEEQSLTYFNHMHKANCALLKKDMKAVKKYADEAMKLHPDFYNRYLMYKHYAGKGNKKKAGEYKALALDNLQKSDEYMYKDLIAELRGEK